MLVYGKFQSNLSTSHLSVFLVVVTAVGLSVLVVRLRQHLGQTLRHPADHSRPAGQSASINLRQAVIFLLNILIFRLKPYLSPSSADWWADKMMKGGKKDEEHFRQTLYKTE